ncbi:MAG: hypothetical protein PHH30_05255 [Bacteroidales bacterium]|nr:hypothetical protein [Bacteroidales bacterium]MDD3858554.1 hypothetical protein [Bacteroidales bacterium]
MKIKTIVILCFVFLALYSCKPSKKELTEQEKLRNEIVNSETELYKSEEIDIDLAYGIIEKYIEFVNKYPSDTLASDYLFKAAEISMNIGESEDAIVFLTRIENNYKKYSNYPACIFLKAFIFENYIGDVEMAQKYYTLFVKDYPNHVLAKDAESALLFLGMNDQQLLELFSVMNK